MIISRHFFYFIFLGLFWGLSQSLYKAMALQNMPISHVIVYAGFGVGVGLMIALSYREPGWISAARSSSSAWAAPSC